MREARVLPPLSTWRNGGAEQQLFAQGIWLVEVAQRAGFQSPESAPGSWTLNHPLLQSGGAECLPPFTFFFPLKHFVSAKKEGPRQKASIGAHFSRLQNCK